MRKSLTNLKNVQNKNKKIKQNNYLLVIKNLLVKLWYQNKGKRTAEYYEIEIKNKSK